MTLVTHRGRYSVLASISGGGTNSVALYEWGFWKSNSGAASAALLNPDRIDQQEEEKKKTLSTQIQFRLCSRTGTDADLAHTSKYCTK